MERRDFLKALGVAGGMAAIGCQHGGTRAQAEAAAASAPETGLNYLAPLVLTRLTVCGTLAL